MTGISPQRYLWRICIAFHIGPRLMIATVYKQYYSALLEERQLTGGHRLLDLCFWLNITEIIALCGVTYVSNRENYRKYYFNLIKIFRVGSWARGPTWVLSLDNSYRVQKTDIFTKVLIVVREYCLWLIFLAQTADIGVRKTWILEYPAKREHWIWPCCSQKTVYKHAQISVLRRKVDSESVL